MENKELKKLQDAKDISDVLTQIQKKCGKESIRLYKDSTPIKVDIIPTGSYLLDKALGIGGLPRGRIIDIYGETMGGKSCLALQIIREAQKLKQQTAFIDAECSFSVELAEGIGVDIDNLAISQPSYGEEALEIAEMLVASGKFAVVVIDSTAALVPKAELDGSMSDQQVGTLARMMGKAMRKLTAIISKTNTCVIFINQIRQNIGFMGGNTTPGGKALKFYSSIRLDVRRIGSVKQGNEDIGNRVKIKVTKNKLAPPFKTIETDLIFGKGIDYTSEILDMCVEKEIISKKGAWFSYNETQLGQGKQSTLEAIKSDKKLLKELTKKVEELK